MIEISDLACAYAVECNEEFALFDVIRATVRCRPGEDADLLRDAFYNHSRVSILGRPFRIDSMATTVHLGGLETCLYLIAAAPEVKVKPETMSYEDWLKWSADELGRAAKRRG